RLACVPARRDASWCVSAPSRCSGAHSVLNASAPVPAKRDRANLQAREGLSQGARDACIRPVSLIMHSFSERHRIATQMCTLRSERIDLYRVFTRAHSLPTGLSAFTALFCL